MGSPWSELLANLAVVAMFVSVWIHTHVWLDSKAALTRATAFGLLMGAGAVTLMLTPMQLQPGLFVDLRGTMIALAGFFGGPVACVIAGLAAVAFRFHEGGIGVFAGAMGIAIAIAIGIAGHVALRGRAPGRVDILILAATAAASSLLGLLALPREIMQAVLPQVALPTSLLIFLSIMLSGLALYQERRRIEALQSRRIYKAVVEALPDCLNVKDLEGRFIAANPATARLMRAVDAKALIGKSDFDFYPRETARKFHEDELAILAAGVPSTIEQRLHHEDGPDGWLSTLKAPLRDQSGAIVGLITHNRDITTRRQLEDELAESRVRLADALTHMADGLVMFDRDGKLVLGNAQYTAMFPRTADIRIPGADYRDILRISAARGEQIVPPDRIEDWIGGIVASRKLPSNRQEIRLSDGRWLDVRTRPTGNGGSLSVYSDITEAKHVEAELLAANEKLNLLANRDGLTELLTRRAFDEALAREYARGKRSMAPLSLLIIDVDWFKRFNDHYGHPAGDECLRAVSGCIKATARRPADAAARYGGEEFALVLPETDARGAFVIAENLRGKVRDLKLAHAGSEKGIVTVSIGVGTFGPGAPIEIADLLRRADEALYGAKAAGRDRVHGWRPHVSEPHVTGARRRP